MPTATNIHHIALTVNSAVDSASFYGDLLGLAEIYSHDDETVSVRVMAGSSFVIGLRQYHGHESDRFTEFRTGLDHFALAVSDRTELAACEAALKAKGVVYTPSAETPFGPVVVFRDPDGIQVEFTVPEVG